MHVGPANNQYYDKCQIIGQSQVSARMSVRRGFAGFAVINEGSQLFIVGGKSPTILKSSEFITPGQPSIPGPDYPGGNRWAIQMANLNSTTLVASGGVSGTEFSSNDNYYFDVPSKTWSRAPNLSVSRNHHCLGTMISNKHSRRTVAVVAGGISHFDNSQTKVFTYTVEILDPQNGQFEKGCFPSDLLSC